MRDPDGLDRALGEHLTEPKASVWFDPPTRRVDLSKGLRLDRRSRMMYDTRHVYLNGEAFRAAGRDATLMQRLADRRGLDAGEVSRLGRQARALVALWAQAGWLHGGTDGTE